MIDWVFHHIGIITPDLEKTRHFYQEALSYTGSQSFHDDVQDAKIILLTKQGSPMIELINPLSEQSPSFGWIKRIRVGPYHTCYAVESLNVALDRLSSRYDLKTVFGPEPAIAFGGALIAFVWGEASGLLELVEIPSM